MDVYGLTGGIGSGKSTVAKMLHEYGIPVVSADELARVVVAPGSEGLERVVEAFGSEVLGETGELDRRRLSAIVFGDVEKRRALEAILHPRIRECYEQVLDALEKAGHPVAVYEVPLLFEKGMQADLKAVILVTAPVDVRIARVQARDGLGESEIKRRMAAQMDEAKKRRKSDYVIDNEVDVDHLRREVEFMLKRFLRVPPPRQAGLAASGIPGSVEEDVTLPPLNDTPEILENAPTQPEPLARLRPVAKSSHADTMPPPSPLKASERPTEPPLPQEAPPEVDMPAPTRLPPEAAKRAVATKPPLPAEKLEVKLEPVPGKASTPPEPAAGSKAPVAPPAANPTPPKSPAPPPAPGSGPQDTDLEAESERTVPRLPSPRVAPKSHKADTQPPTAKPSAATQPPDGSKLPGGKRLPPPAPKTAAPPKVPPPPVTAKGSGKLPPPPSVPPPPTTEE